MTAKALVLVISGDPAMHQLVKSVISELCDVAQAFSAKLPVWRGETRAPSVVVLDELADAPPEQVMADVADRWPRVRAVLLGPAGDSALQGRLGALGALVVKPISRERLHSAVAQRLRIAALSAGVEDLLAASGVHSQLDDGGRPRRR